jgi:IclR family pca regulon transcriptional regulator
MSRNFVQSVEKGLSILSTFSAQKPDLTLSELAKATGLTLVTAHRYLFTLKKLGFVTRSEDNKKYRLTPKVLSLGFSALKSMDLKIRTIPYMIQLTKERNVTSQCAILEGTEIVYIERLRSAGDLVHLDLTVGSRLPAYATAMGKAILAFLDEEESRKLIDQMNLMPFTPQTITTKKVLRKELQIIRQKGYAINNQETFLGIRALAAPIFVDDKVEAALGISFPINRTEGNNLEPTLIEEMMDIARKVSIG